MVTATDCAMTKQFGSTMPSSPQILAAQRTDRSIALETALSFKDGWLTVFLWLKLENIKYWIWFRKKKQKTSKFLSALTISHQRCRFWSVLWWESASQRLERCTWWRWLPHLSLYLKTKKMLIIQWSYKTHKSDNLKNRFLKQYRHMYKVQKSIFITIVFPPVSAGCKKILFKSKMCKKRETGLVLCMNFFYNSAEDSVSLSVPVQQVSKQHVAFCGFNID